jgi:hypothetical protein
MIIPNYSIVIKMLIVREALCILFPWDWVTEILPYGRALFSFCFLSIHIISEQISCNAIKLLFKHVVKLFEESP